MPSPAVRRALEALGHACTTLRASTCTRVADIQFDGTLFVPHIEKLGAVVSHQHGSIPSDTPSIVNQLREGLDALHTMRQNIPESAGATLFKAIDGGITDIIDGIYTWAIANTEAVLRQWKLHRSMIDDAIEEFESALTDDPVDSLTDTMRLPKTEWEHHICQCALASAKLIKQLLQKVEQRGIASTPAPPPSWQDSCLVIANQLFEQVDQLGDLFWFLPSDKASARIDAYEHLDELYTAANDLAELAREQFTEPHRNWLDLCLTQLDKQRQSVKD
ncbi:hypothetical protein BDF22DRAFT_675649 [Syncephalis plumigaleata]|nr:hypothetical protein BDF22DRAFT_675649 [Syncephalis plumigaleata]